MNSHEEKAHGLIEYLNQEIVGEMTDSISAVEIALDDLGIKEQTPEWFEVAKKFDELTAALLVLQTAIENRYQ